MDDLTLDTILNPLVWTCDACTKPIDDEDGWLTVDERGAWQLQAEWETIEALKAEHNGLVPFAAVDTWPERHVHWRAYHVDCDPAIDDKWCYWFAIERIRTFSHVLNWNMHLNHKVWMRYTDWNEMLNRRIGGGTDA